MNRFVAPGPYSIGSEIPLDRDESHHLTKVLRLEIGQSLELTDGKGLLAKAQLIHTQSRIATVRVEAIHESLPQSRLTIAFALSKPAACEFIIRRCTELGIKSFQPLITQHSQKKSYWNPERWERILVEACKQSQQTWFPHLNELAELKDWITRQKDWLVCCDENDRTASLPKTPSGEPVTLILGAEGGWNNDERELFRKAKVHLWGLGHTRLRTETAALVACTLLKNHLEEI